MVRLVFFFFSPMIKFDCFQVEFRVLRKNCSSALLCKMKALFCDLSCFKALAIVARVVC